MSTRQTSLGSVAAAILAVPAMALAQPAPADNSIDQRVRQVQGAILEDAARQESILTGRDDIVLIRRRQFFTVSAAAAVLDTTNAALSTDANGDQFATLDVSLRAATVLGGRVDVYAEAGASTAQYRRFESLGYVAVSGALGAHSRVWGVDLDATYTPNIIFVHEADERQLTQHRVSLGLARAIRLRNLSIRADAGLERIWADPSPYSNTGASIGLSLATPLTSDGRLTGFASIRGVGRNYDNYFEAFVGTPRRDRLLEGSLGLSYALTRRASLEVRWTQSRNWSSSDVNRWQGGVGSLGIRTALRF